MKKPPGRWTVADATKRINECAKDQNLSITLTGHAKDQMLDRDLIMGDLRHVLRSGFVYDEPEEATQAGFFKYRIEGTTPNSDGRTVRVVVIPSGGHELKIVTVMWRDER